MKENRKGSVTYLNSGDWVENLTALEYQEKEWTLYRHEHNADIEVLENEDEYVEMESQLESQLITAVLFNKK